MPCISDCDDDKKVKTELDKVTRLLCTFLKFTISEENIDLSEPYLRELTNWYRTHENWDKTKSSWDVSTRYGYQT